MRAQRLVRLDDAARSPRRRRRPPRPLPLPRQERGDSEPIDLEDPLLARGVQRCLDLPGQTLFQYVDETGARADDLVDRRQRLLPGSRRRGLHGEGLPDWSGTVLAASALCADIELGSATARKRLCPRPSARSPRGSGHQGGVPQVLRAPDGDRRLPRGRDDRAVRPHHRPGKGRPAPAVRGRGGGSEAPHSAARGPHQASRGVTRPRLVGSHSRTRISARRCGRRADSAAACASYGSASPRRAPRRSLAFPHPRHGGTSLEVPCGLPGGASGSLAARPARA